jgi:predicted CXXCH cytochrome family protein
MMGFKRWVAKATMRSSLGTIAMAFAMAVGGLAASSLPAQAQGIKDTKHNLGTQGTKVTGQNQYSGTAEICVFCHTPHGADNSASVPLWNRTLGPGTGYTTYDSLGTSTLDGKTATLVGSVSIACLSCHDGTQAMNSVLNAPGSGSVAMTGTWTGAGVNTTTGLMTGATTNLGTDLSNDHPIGIQYGGGGISSAGGTTTDVDFVQPTKGTGNIWWVETGGAGRQKTDMMLYTRTGAYTGQTNPEPFVECASCHDPHTQTATFLRVANTGSAVCLACHIK